MKLGRHGEAPGRRLFPSGFVGARKGRGVLSRASTSTFAAQPFQQHVSLFARPLHVAGRPEAQGFQEQFGRVRSACPTMLFQRLQNLGVVQLHECAGHVEFSRGSGYPMNSFGRRDDRKTPGCSRSRRQTPLHEGHRISLLIGRASERRPSMAVTAHLPTPEATGLSDSAAAPSRRCAPRSTIASSSARLPCPTPENPPAPSTCRAWSRRGP